MITTIGESKEKFECTLDEDILDIVKDVYDVEQMKKCMSELGLDLEKLPIGNLTLDKLSRGHSILVEIQNHLVTGGK